MPTYRTRVLALKKTKLGESDLIVTLLAENGCQVRAVAKGARKTSSKFGARLEPFSVCDVMLATGRTLEIVTDAETVVSNAVLREDYDRSSAGSVVADFLDKVSVECQTEERLFGLAVTTLDVMTTARVEDLLAIVVAFLVKGMAMHGYRPQFDACVSCGCASPSGGRFSLDLGGPLCEACCGDQADTVSADESTRSALRALLGARMADVPGLKVPRPVALSGLRLMRGFAAYHVPARLKALDLYCAEALR